MIMEKQLNNTKMCKIGCTHHVLQHLEDAMYREEFEKTKGTEESFAKEVKKWYNGNKDKDFESYTRVPSTRSPLLTKMREDTIELLNRILAPEHSEGLRGDYKKLLKKHWYMFLGREILPPSPMTNT